MVQEYNSKKCSVWREKRVDRTKKESQRFLTVVILPVAFLTNSVLSAKADAWEYAQTEQASLL